MLLFVLNGSGILGKRVASSGGFLIAPHEEREFDGGEHKARPLVSVRGKDVFVLHSLHGDAQATANDKLIRLLFFLAACREHGAARVTAIAPYLPYSRKDRQTKPHDPVNSRYVAQLFEAIGVDRVITIEVHNLSAFQNGFRCRTLHLSTDGLFASDVAARHGRDRLSIVSPDAGGVKRAQLLKEALEQRGIADVTFGVMEKRRSAGEVTGSLFAGDVADRTVFIVDDMICGGGTVLRAANAVRAHGATKVRVLATHGLMRGETLGNLGAPGVIDSITLTDSVAPLPGSPDNSPPCLRILGCGALIASAISALHNGTEFESSSYQLPLVDINQ